MKKLISILLIAQALFSYTYEELKNEPNSLAKDFFLYNLLKNNEIKKEDLKEFKTHIFRFAGVMKKEYEKLSKDIKEEPKTLPADSCYNYSINSIMNADEKCQIFRLKEINFAKKLSKENLIKLANIYKQKDKNLSSQLSILANKNPVAESIKKGDGKTLMKLYYDGYKLDDFSPGPLTRASMMEHPNAYKFLNSAIVDDKYPKIKEKLASLDKEDAKEDLAFALGLNALMFNKNALAEKYFLRANKTYKYKRPKDNALFFAYLASNKTRHLDTLANSDDLNIYSILAKELTNTPLPTIITPNPTKSIDYPINNALVQARFMNDIKNADTQKLSEMQEYFNTKNTQGQYLVISDKLSNFKDNIYPIPFPEELANYSVEQKALILAIAKQESRFLPASVSTSYALGMMQFMPFVARHTAKVDFNDNDFDVTQMFDPKIAYKFANAHLNTLKKGVKHPIFIAYAYNGGLGFTQRMLKKDYMFNPNSKLKSYEPFLSMELVPYLESRLYGKKVLANYYIYLKILGQNVKMSDLIKQIDKNQ
ncbi:lytic transglycosylase domain-containing protein [Campylobacter sp. 2018MI13]|uniref:lytic transglycosylase domain-containing protein n=1 Tax=Campylobacter sp. 2018MI13 TaxID=2836737 RepID=UPI001BDB403A|nr:lytic transglycosylase domain-containing protein [Campylobacter sp. 2018MI13]MBT0882949.1 lytic transglycosylase domain-containing protein [Campylobacter sp. 2018MI13]